MTAAMISAVGLGFSYDKQVLDGFDLEAEGGSVTAIVGLNGAGKTTALRLLSGQMPPSEGRVRILGQDPARAATRRDLWYLPEVSDLPLHLTALEAVTFFRDLFGRPRGTRDERLGVLERVRLEDAARKRALTFSKGMRRRLELACMLAVDTRVWILDEGQTGLDPEGVHLLRQLCSQARDEGRAVVMATHDLEDVKLLADRVMLLREGRTVFDGDRDAVRRASGTRGFVIEGGDAAIDDAVREVVEKHGGHVRGPDMASEGLVRLLFGSDDADEAGDTA